MAKATSKKRHTAPSPAKAAAIDRWRVLGPAILAAMTLFCYWTPMTSDGTSILWDAADYFQVVQNYLSQELHAGRIPFWSPYPWSGYPFLADPQVGAWYPLNWPFFLIGVSPHMLVVEHWLHALVASLGAYFLAWRLTKHRQAAVVAGLCYGLSGFYVGHSSHTAMLECAAWTPWLMLLFDQALESRPRWYITLGGLAAGMMILAGHFQTILYSFLALGLFAVARVIAEPRRWAAILSMALAIPVIGTLLSAIGTGPGLELTVNSIRAGLAGANIRDGIIPLSALATLVDPNFYGVFSDSYHGPQDITQYYFYAGILLLPLAIYGLRSLKTRWIGALLVVPTIWYAMGPAGGLFRVMAALPGFRNVRAPVNIWFVPALGLALLAAAGLAALAQRMRMAWLPWAVMIFFCADLFYFQSATNPLAYARQSYDELYGSKEGLFERVVAGMPPLTRFEARDNITSFGPLMHALALDTEVTYNYGPLKLSRYAAFVDTLRSNPELRKDLNVSRWLEARNGSVHEVAGTLARANFPQELVVAAPGEDLPRLAKLDPTRQALVPAGTAVAAQDAHATAEVREFTPGHYRIHYKCATASLLRVSNSYFPGWTAEAQGRTLAVIPVDHALLGVVVPAGEGDVALNYHSTYFAACAWLSLIALGGCAGLLAWQRRPGSRG